MIDISFIQDEFGINPPLPEDLVQSSFRFMMAFYYCEERFFKRYCQFTEAPDYAHRIIGCQKSDPSQEIDVAFQFLHKRYISSSDSDHRRFALVSALRNPSPSEQSIKDSLCSADGSAHSKLTASLYVIIRLRHNLFHANKFEAMSDDPEGQKVLLDHAADLLGYLLKNSQ